jgi:tetratricopeptide (TPR) repeat protein
MFRLFSRCLIVLALIFPMAPPLLSQGPQYGSIVGQVRVARSAFPSKAVLVLLNTRGATIASAYTDNEGRFTFNGLLGNPYRVVINDPDYAPVDELIALDPSTGAVRMLNITLVPRADVAEPKSGEETDVGIGTNPNVTSPAGLRHTIPDSALREFKAGVGAEKKNKVEDATRHYRRAIELAPDFYEARNNLGSLALSHSDFSTAREQFETAMKLNPSEAASYFNLANVFILTKNPAEAVKVARDGLRLQPTSAFGHFVLGTALGNAGNAIDAERELRRALELDSKMTKAHLALVNIYLQQQRRDSAVEELRSFLKSSPDDPFAPKAREVLKRLETSK